jgi:hypothetical protein
LSFQATSSDFRFISAKDGRKAVCVENRALIVVEPNGFGFGVSSCPDWKDGKPAAVVNVEKPTFVTLGAILVMFGFAVQFFSFPGPKSTAEMRKEIKEFQRAEDMKRKINPHTGLPHSKK